MDAYIRVVYGATIKSYEMCYENSVLLGFLTGEENKLMKDTHVESIMVVGEPFIEGEFDFGSQTMTERIYKLMSVMLKNRLRPPPQEVYSLHRKLSGIQNLLYLFSFIFIWKINFNF